MHCARCGQDLRGLTEPKCPACELEFDWADAVPLEQLTCPKCEYHLCGLTETRCPECGTPFSWRDVLDAYHQTGQPLFEYRWREQPVRSFLRTWWRSLRPGKFWRTIDIHDPPRTGGLILFLAVAGVILIASMPAAAVLAKAATLAWDKLLYPAAWVGFSVSRVGSSWTYVSRSYWSPWMRGLGWYGDWLWFVAVWFVAGFLALLILRRSMAKAKVNARHVFRAYVYATLSVTSGQILYCLVVFMLDVCAIRWPIFYRHPIGDAVAIAFPFVVWFWTVRSLALGYKLYIRMKHAWAVAISTQLIAVLSACIVLLLPVVLRSL